MQLFDRASYSVLNFILHFSFFLLLHHLLGLIFFIYIFSIFNVVVIMQGSWILFYIYIFIYILLAFSSCSFKMESRKGRLQLTRFVYFLVYPFIVEKSIERRNRETISNKLPLSRWANVVVTFDFFPPLKVPFVRLAVSWGCFILLFCPWKLLLWTATPVALGQREKWIHWIP